MPCTDPHKTGWPYDERFRWGLAVLLTVGGVLLVHLKSLAIIFSSEDWTVVGPPAVKRFLDDPFSLFGFLASGHYNLLGKLFFTLESLVFRQDPAGYHLVGLVLLSALSLLLLGFMRSFGAGFAASLLASLCFALNWVNCHVLMQVYNQHYLLLGMLLLGSLIFFRAYLERGQRRDLLTCAVLTGVAQYVHSTAVVFPAIAALLLLPGPLGWPSPAVGKRQKALAILLLAGVVVGLQALPRIILGAHIDGVGASPSLNLPGFARTLWAVLWTWGVTIGDFLSPAAAWALAGLVAAGAAAWAWKPRLLPLLVLGLGIMGLILAPPVFTLNWRPEFFASRFRYMFMPALGAALVLGVLLESLARGAGGAGRWKRPIEWVGKAAAAALACLYLAGSVAGNSYFYDFFGAQSRFVRSVAAVYQGTAERLFRESGCGSIMVQDVPLVRTRPGDLQGVLLIQGLDHGTLHRFYFALDPGMMQRFEFRAPDPSSGKGDGPCEFRLVNGLAL